MRIVALVACLLALATPARAASGDKKLHIVPGGNHMSFYDVPRYVDEAVSVLAPFFQSKLN